MFYQLVVLPYITYMFVYWLTSLIYCLFDYIFEKKNLLVKYKLQSSDIIKNNGLDWDKYIKTVKYVLKLQTILLPIFLLAIYPITKYCINASNGWPSIYKMIYGIIVSILLFDICFYHIHYLLHKPYFYKKYHKIHHEWIAPVACRAHYVHPVEYIIGTFIPSFIGPVLLEMHYITLLIWIAGSTFAVTMTHSGFNLKMLMAKEHDDHHKYFNANYGVIYIIDRLYGTYKY